MKFRFGYIVLTALAGILMNSCIEYDMSYPRVRAEFTSFEVDDAVAVDIDPSTMTVTVTLSESGDLSNVSISKVSLSDNTRYKDAELPNTLDLSKGPYEVFLSNYHDYRWTIKTVQPVER